MSNTEPQKSLQTPCLLIFSAYFQKNEPFVYKSAEQPMAKTCFELFHATWDEKFREIRHGPYGTREYNEVHPEKTFLFAELVSNRRPHRNQTLPAVSGSSVTFPLCNDGKYKICTFKQEIQVFEG